MSDFLGFTDKTFLVTGFANRKSVAWHVSKILEKEGARVIFTVRSENRKDELLVLKPDAEIIICDFENSKEIDELNGSANLCSPIPRLLFYFYLYFCFGFNFALLTGFSRLSFSSPSSNLYWAPFASTAPPVEWISPASNFPGPLHSIR